MNRTRNPTPNTRWSTSSFGSPADTSPTELIALGEHLCRCNALRGGALFGLRRFCEAINEFAAPRLMTTLALCALLAVFASLVT